MCVFLPNNRTPCFFNFASNSDTRSGNAGMASSTEESVSSLNSGKCKYSTARCCSSASKTLVCSSNTGVTIALISG